MFNPQARTMTAEENMQGIVNRLTNVDDNQRIGCRKCGFAGHLTFQCYNSIETTASHDFVDVASTSSDSETELKQIEILLEEKKKRDAKHAEKKKKKKEKHKRRKRKHESESSDSEEEVYKEKRKKRDKKDKRKKKKKEKKHESSSSSSSWLRYQSFGSCPREFVTVNIHELIYLTQMPF